MGKALNLRPFSGGSTQGMSQRPIEEKDRVEPGPEKQPSLSTPVTPVHETSGLHNFHPVTPATLPRASSSVKGDILFHSPQLRPHANLSSDTQQDDGLHRPSPIRWVDPSPQVLLSDQGTQGLRHVIFLSHGISDGNQRTGSRAEQAHETSKRYRTLNQAPSLNATHASSFVDGPPETRSWNQALPERPHTESQMEHNVPYNAYEDDRQSKRPRTDNFQEPVRLASPSLRTLGPPPSTSAAHEYSHIAQGGVGPSLAPRHGEACGYVPYGRENPTTKTPTTPNSSYLPSALGGIPVQSSPSQADALPQPALLSTTRSTTGTKAH
ncbi:hypothetical protein M427DRAFT_142935, partial [Gonapodya prolifera JEL478]